MQQPFQKQAWHKRLNAVPQAHDESMGLVLIFGVLIALSGAALGIALSAKVNLFALGALAAVLIFATIRAPIFSVCLAASTDLTCYYISGLTKFPPRIYLISLVALISIPKFIVLFRSTPFIRKIVAAILAFSAVRFAVDFYWGADLASLARVTLSRQISPMLVFLCCATYANTRKNLTLLLMALFAATAISALFGILQFHGVNFAWDFHHWLQSFAKGDPSESEGNMFSLYVLGKLLRPTGLANTTIEFSYHLVSALGFAFPILLLSSNSRMARTILGGMLIIIIIATIESLTRSAIVGMLIIIASTLWARTKISKPNSQARIRRSPWLITIFLLASMIVSFETLGPSEEASRVYKYEDNTRISLYISTLRMLRIYPLGTGGGRREQVVLEHQADLMDVPDPTALLMFAPHNGFLLAAFTWGLPALFISLMLFMALFKEAKQLRNRVQQIPPWLSNVGIIFPIFLIGYLPNTMFHNGFPLNGDIVFWYYVGAFAAVARTLKWTQANGSAARTHMATADAQSPPTGPTEDSPLTA